jgi:hypothetical protein
MPSMTLAVRGGVFALGLLLCGASEASAQVDLLPLGATYRYLISPGRTNPPGGEAPEFDDSAFSTGSAPFGLNVGGITWGVFEGLTARRTLNLTSIPTGAVLRVRLNGYGSFYINGELICQLENCGSINEMAIPMCDGLMRVGDNVFAAVLIANCGGAYFDAYITATGATTITPTSWGRLKTHYR